MKSKRVKFLGAEKMGPDSRIEGPIADTPHGAESFFKDSEGNQVLLWEPPSIAKWKWHRR